MEKEYAQKIELLLSEYFEYRKAKEMGSASNRATSVAPKYNPQGQRNSRWFPNPLPADTNAYKNNGVPMNNGNAPNNNMPNINNGATPNNNIPNMNNGTAPNNNMPNMNNGTAPNSNMPNMNNGTNPNNNMPNMNNGTGTEQEGEYAGALSDSVSKKLVPYAVQEVDKMDYDGSPIYDDLDKETIAQMTTSAYDNAVQNVPELGDLETVSERAYFNKSQLVRALIRELILKEIYLVRRRRMIKNIFK